MDSFETRILKERALITIVVFGILFLAIRSITYAVKIDRLQSENAVLQQRILESEKRVATIKKTVDTVTIEIEKKVEKIKYLKKIEYVKVKMVDSLPISGVQRYFTDRYER
jgi:hypothetical protein